MTANPAALFYMLFEGHPDRYGTEEGGAVRGDAYEAVERHCFKGIPIGIYPMTDEGTVKWGCSDFDSGETFEDASKLAKVLAKMGVRPWVEVSRSKGHHVWVFSETFVPAATMRRFFLFAHHVAELPPREVNPKQEQPGPKGFSNYVRAPYVGCGPDENGRRVMVNGSGQPYEFHDFLETAIATQTNAHTLQRWADKYKPPVVERGHDDTPASRMSPTILQSLNGWCRKVLTEGVAEWRYEPGMGGRSGALARLAYEVRKSGQPRPVAKAVLYYADDLWGKYTDRDPANRNEIINRLLDDAYR